MRLALALMMLLAGPAAGQTLMPTVIPPPAPRPDPSGSLTLQYENDTLAGTDRYYTSGVQIAYRSPSTNLPGLLRFMDDQLDRLLPPGEVRWGFGLGHAIYTPRDTLSRIPDPTDRPYAGHLYGALVLQRDEGSALSTLELQAGVVGPSALGEFLQNNVHDLIRDFSANGWRSQLKDEPALNIVFERTARTPALTFGGIEMDLLPSATLALGTVSTYAGAGVALRIGNGLDADYGAPRIRPALVGSSFFQPRQDFGWYGFIGGQGRAVLHDVFLDGNTWTDNGPSVSKRSLVGDLSAGFVVHWRGFRLAYSQVMRSEEFYGQRGGAQSFGSLGLTARF